MKVTGLLQFIEGATQTTSAPELAEAGMVTEMDVGLQELIEVALSLSRTTLPPCGPKPVPETVTCAPT